SDGPDRHYPGYDYVAVAKSVLETFVRYMATHLRDHDVKVNALRTRQVPTDSYAQIFGEQNTAIAERFAEFAVTPEEVATATLGLCSGLFDSFSGQVLQLDRGAAFVDNIMTMGARLLDSDGGFGSAPKHSPPASLRAATRPSQAKPAPSLTELIVQPERPPNTIAATLRQRLEGKAVLITGGTK